MQDTNDTHTHTHTLDRFIYESTNPSQRDLDAMQQTMDTGEIPVNTNPPDSPDIPEEARKGDCYEAAFRFMGTVIQEGATDDMPQHVIDSMRLVHAEVMGQGRLDGVKFGHAYVVATLPHGLDFAYDYSNGQSISIPLGMYEKIGDIDRINNRHTYTYEEACKQMLRHMHYGPWDLETSTGL